MKALPGLVRVGSRRVLLRLIPSGIETALLLSGICVPRIAWAKATEAGPGGILRRLRTAGRTAAIETALRTFCLTRRTLASVAAEEMLIVVCTSRNCIGFYLSVGGMETFM